MYRKSNFVLLMKICQVYPGVENTLRTILRLQIFGFERLDQDPEATEQFSKVVLSRLKY